MRAGSRGSARTSELGMGAGFGGQTAQPHVDALQQSLRADKGFAAGADMGMGSYSNGGGSGGSSVPPSRGRGGGGNGGGRGGGNRGGGSGGPGGPAGRGRGGYPQPPSFRPPLQQQNEDKDEDDSEIAGSASVLDSYPKFPPPSTSSTSSPSSFQTQTQAQAQPQMQTQNARTVQFETSIPASVMSRTMPEGLEIGKLRAELTAVTKRLNAIDEDATWQFYGIVAGGAANAVLLFPELPSDAKTVPPCAKASRSKWLKLSYPRVRREIASTTLSADGSSTSTWWYRVHVVDAPSGDYRLLWVCDRADDGTPAFERFAMYPQ